MSNQWNERSKNIPEIMFLSLTSNQYDQSPSAKLLNYFLLRIELDCSIKINKAFHKKSPILWKQGNTSLWLLFILIRPSDWIDAFPLDSRFLSGIEPTLLLPLFDFIFAYSSSLLLEIFSRGLWSTSQQSRLINNSRGLKVDPCPNSRVSRNGGWNVSSHHLFTTPLVTN